MKKLFAALVAVTTLALSAAYADSAIYRNNTTSGRGSRDVNGAHLGSWDPAVSVSVDSGYIDTAGCSAGCLAAYVEVETATTAATCVMHAIANGDNGVTTDDWDITLLSTTVAASSGTWALSVCPGVTMSPPAGWGAAGSYGMARPLPKHVRLTCAQVAGVNMRAYMQCH